VQRQSTFWWGCVLELLPAGVAGQHSVEPAGEEVDQRLGVRGDREAECRAACPEK
jgi:hypothetical protein